MVNEEGLASLLLKFRTINISLSFIFIHNYAIETEREMGMQNEPQQLTIIPVKVIGFFRNTSELECKNGLALKIMNKLLQLLRTLIM